MKKYHIHRINRLAHQDFLKENRQDPITGDSIQIGDEVVFCAVCQSAFLKDSWEYLNRNHCEQNQTLVDFPKTQKLTLNEDNQPILFSFTCKEYIKRELSHSTIPLPDIKSSGVVVSSMLMLFLIGSYSNLSAIYLSLIALVSILLLGILWWHKHDKEEDYQEKTMSLDPKKQVNSIDVLPTYLRFHFKAYDKTQKQSFKNIQAVSIFYQSTSKRFEFITKGNHTYVFIIKLNDKEIFDLLETLTQITPTVSIFLREFPYQERLKFREWEEKYEQIHLY